MRIALTCSRPVLHTFELDTTNNGLHFKHPPIGTKTLMQPAETRSVFALIYSLIAFAMILKAPHGTPKGFIIGSDHAPLTTCGHDLVLAKTPSTHMTNATDATPLVLRSVSLRAILNHFQTMLIRQSHDRIHIAWPSSQVDANDSLRSGRQYLCDGRSRNIATVQFHICKHWRSSSIDNTGNTGNKSTRRNYNLVTWPNVKSLQCNIQCQRTIA